MMSKISNRRNEIAFLTFIIIEMMQLCSAEVLTSITDMEELFETEAVLINNLQAYVEAQEQKLNFLRRRINVYQREHDEAARDISTYISNPINAYLLTKRLTSDWSIVEQVISRDLASEFLENVTMNRNFIKFPSYEDLNSAAVALTRLQDTYNLDTAAIARCELNGVKCSSQMSSHDCFEMGRQTFLNSDYYHTLLWMNEAMARLNNTNNNTSTKNEPNLVQKAEILEYLAFSVFKQGDIRSALEMTNELLTLSPNHPAAENKEFYEKELAKEIKMKADKMLRGDNGSPELNDGPQTISVIDPNEYTTEVRKQYEKLCRGEIVRDERLLAQLKCRYVTNKSPFLKIAPLKLEEASLKPYIVVYHDVIYDREIELIKQMAKPRFRRATGQNQKTGETEITTYRTCKLAWLKDTDDDIIRNIGIRVEDMTGLTVSTAEELHVVNYGIGGHYEPHFDFARPEDKDTFARFGTDNRIATVLFYLSDVAQGGATVFPNLNVALWPKKGTAAFWLNLHKDGVGDYSTRHAACPVLTGSKWISTKWLHEKGQEFLMPCDHEPDHPSSY